MMMNKIIRYLPALAIMTLISVSCEEEIRFRGEKIDPKIVIYSLLQPDSMITVSVAKSHAVFEERYVPKQITDAVVKLYRDDEFVETLTYVVPEPQPEYYSAVPYSKYVSQGVKPIYGSTYRIEVEMAGMKKASGMARLPDIVPVNGLDTIEDQQADGNILMEAKVRFSDPGGKNNFYRIAARSAEGMYYGDKSVPWSPGTPVSIYENDCSYASSNDPVISPQKEEQDLFDMQIYNTYHIFSDELIAGKEYALTLELSHRWPDTDYYEFSLFNFELQSITEDLYMYLRTSSAHMQTNDAYIIEPVLVFTNIENGLGVVGAMSSSTVTLKVGEYPVDGVTYEVIRY
jgi:hypothetical protein